MREILFRGKRSDDNEWVEGFYVRCRGHHYILPVYDCDNGFDERYSDWIQIDPTTVCQYTGLTDKNGRKIFEGDIVQYYPFKAVVKFGEFENQVLKNVGFNLDWFNVDYYRQDLPYWIDKIEVIGNIFDNPEQLHRQ